MLQIGRSIAHKDDLLQNIGLERLVSLIKEPDSEVSLLTRRARTVRLIDQKQYTIIQQQLPYIVCGIFQPPYRRIENFGYIHYFMIDIEHISDKGVSLNVLRQQVVQDIRVCLCFVTPNENGLKVLFRLKDRCHDAGMYALFYRSFVRSLSAQYLRNQVVDKDSSDVSKVSFLCEDTEAYYNPNAEPIEMSLFVNFENPLETQELKHVLEQETKGLEPRKEPAISVSAPDEAAITFIKERLRSRPSTKHQETVYVPQEVEQVLADLVEYVKESGVEVVEILNIQYGKKFRFRLGIKQAEINLFWGKRGFSVVKSPRKGTSAELNDLMVQYVSLFVGKLYDV